MWIALEPAKLSSTAQEVLTDSRTRLFLSVTSAWEIAIKAQLGRLPLPIRADRYIAEVRRLRQIESLPLSEDAVAHLTALPAIHRDPFDRILVCQALEHRLPIVTPDREISGYPVVTIW